jgi:excisionase family DNA binding protein
MLTSAEVRKRLGIGRDKLRELIQTGELEAIKTGDAVNAPYRVSEEALAAYIESRKVRPEAVGQ